jgi:predicted MPP superfamily phosphohydrolase
VGGYLFGFFVILTLLLLALHAVQLKWSLPRKGTALLTLVLAFSITASGALWANHFGVSKIEIPMDALKQDVAVMHIPDVHIGHHRGKDYLAKIVAETNRCKPDIVLINGDLVDSNVALLPDVLSPLSDFKAPVYFTGGNHEKYVDTERALELIKKYGVRILHNEVVDTHGIYLVGLDYMNPDEKTFDMHPSDDKRTIKNVLPTIPLKDDQPSVLMHHSPVGVQYVSAKGIDLMLSGHTHAGQMFPGTLLAPFFFPFIKGLYQEGSTKVLVSQGAGTYGPRMRLGSSNEINFIRLKVKK